LIKDIYSNIEEKRYILNKIREFMEHRKKLGYVTGIINKELS